MTGTPPERPKTSDPKAIARGIAKQLDQALKDAISGRPRSPAGRPRYICTNCGYAAQPVYEMPRQQRKASLPTEAGKTPLMAFFLNNRVKHLE